MKEYNPDPAVKKVRYIASIIYLLILAFIVGGSYVHQQQDNVIDSEDIAEKVLMPSTKYKTKNILTKFIS